MGNKDSWSEISSSVRGPRRHSKATIELREILSPSFTNWRKRSPERLGPVNASINTDVSRWITSTLFVDRRFSAPHECHGSRRQQRPAYGSGAGPSYDQELAACARVRLCSDD